jgi:hypothetical protein
MMLRLGSVSAVQRHRERRPEGASPLAELNCRRCRGPENYGSVYQIESKYLPAAQLPVPRSVATGASAGGPAEAHAAMPRIAALAYSVAPNRAPKIRFRRSCWFGVPASWNLRFSATAERGRTRQPRVQGCTAAALPHDLPDPFRTPLSLQMCP